VRAKSSRETIKELSAENATLRARLAEIEEVLRAIRCGEVDAFLVSSAAGERVLTLEGTESAYRLLVEAMSEGATILRDKGMLLYCNGRLAAMLNAPLERVMGESLFRFVVPAERKELHRLLQQGSREVCAGNFMLRREDGATVPVRLSLSPMRIHGLPGIGVVATDLTEHLRVQEQLRDLSLRDELTGLLNRRGFLLHAQQEMKLARRYKGKLSLVFGDLDGMKQINDQLGHREGDRALMDAAEILKTTCRETDLIARLGGDEFAVLVMGAPAVEMESLGARLQRQLDAHNAHSHRPYQLAMSVGIVACTHGEQQSCTDLLARADALMYEHKRHKHEQGEAHSPLVAVTSTAFQKTGGGDPVGYLM
jgi:diguanylate cyclase (GGDEF)-like protein/PAS domain S-box-containing protein